MDWYISSSFDTMIHREETFTGQNRKILKIDICIEIALESENMNTYVNLIPIISYS